jgi:protein LSM14
MPTAAQQQNATQLATAAVAEAMAKLNLQNKGQAQGQAQGQPQGQAPVTDPMNNLAQQVQGMRDQQSRQHQPRQRGTGEFRGRGGRGGRGGVHSQHPKMEVPTTDFDFESSNAKFNKQDLIKEAIASGSPMGDAPAAPAVEAASTEKEEVVIPGGSMYDKSSFFDNISSELKDREEAAMRGQEFRSQERQKNMETFGQGSVDGYRGGRGGRGRGRGRGRGFGGYRGRGAPRGRGGAEFGAQPAA